MGRDRSTATHSRGQDRPPPLSSISYLQWHWGLPSPMPGRTSASVSLPRLLPLHCTAEEDLVNAEVHYLSASILADKVHSVTQLKHLNCLQNLHYKNKAFYMQFLYDLKWFLFTIYSLLKLQFLKGSGVSETKRKLAAINTRITIATAKSKEQCNG